MLLLSQVQATVYEKLISRFVARMIRLVEVSSRTNPKMARSVAFSETRIACSTFETETLKRPGASMPARPTTTASHFLVYLDRGALAVKLRSIPRRRVPSRTRNRDDILHRKM